MEDAKLLERAKALIVELRKGDYTLRRSAVDQAAFDGSWEARIVAALRAAVGVERNECHAIALRVAEDAYEAEERAISKGGAEYTRIFRNCVLVERINAAFAPPDDEEEYVHTLPSQREGI